MSEDTKYQTITIRGDLYDRLDKLRQRQAKTLGLPKLSWNDFLTKSEEVLKDQIRAVEQK